MKDMSLTKFVEVTASKSPVPGGGSVAALCGALSGALAEMVSNLTIGNKKYIKVEAEMIAIRDKAFILKKSLLDYIKKDSDVFMLVMDAYKLPKGNDEEKSIRSKNIQKRLKEAANIPLEVANMSYEIMGLSEIVVKKGNKNAITDGLVCAMLARTSVLAALLNVKINLSSISDKEFVSELSKKVNELETKCINDESRILKSVSL